MSTTVGAAEEGNTFDAVKAAVEVDCEGAVVGFSYGEGAVVGFSYGEGAIANTGSAGADSAAGARSIRSQVGDGDQVLIEVIIEVLKVDACCRS